MSKLLRQIVTNGTKEKVEKRKPLEFLSIWSILKNSTFCERYNRKVK